jgi:hypothetical protein
MAPDKVGWIVTSALTNNNERTVLSSTLAPGTTTAVHYHTQFTETFTLNSGSLTVLRAPEGDLSGDTLHATELKIGESATVAVGQLHTFQAGDTETKTTVTFEPGSLGFERTILIMQGMQRDGTYLEFGVPTPESMPLLAVIGELTDTNNIGEVKKALDAVCAERGNEIAEKKRELIEKYATDEHLAQGTVL